MLTRFSKAWQGAPSAYSWFVSRQQGPARVLYLSVPSAPSERSSATDAAGASRRFWAVRYAVSNRLLCFVALLTLFAVSLAQAARLAVIAEQGAALYVWAIAGSMLQAPLLLGALLALLIEGYHKSAGLLLLGLLLVGLRSAVVTPHGVAALPLQRRYHPCKGEAAGVSKLALTRLSFEILQQLALGTEPGSAPSARCRGGVTAAPMGIVVLPMWVRLPSVASLALQSCWPSFNLQCGDRAVTSRLLATAWGRRAEVWQQGGAAWAVGRSSRSLEGLGSAVGRIALRKGAALSALISPSPVTGVASVQGRRLSVSNQQPQMWQLVQNEFVWAPLGLWNLSTEVW